LAHDLRSPLTRIKSRLELALVSDAGVEKQRQEMQYTISETDQLLRTFNALLSIAEAEGGAARANMKPLDLYEIAQDVADLYRPMAEDRGLVLDLAGAAGVMITGHRQLLLQALLNLVDNAIKYTNTGKITLAVLYDGKNSVLAVTDTGPGIPPEDRVRVLDQFVRLDPARTTRGNGLGLSLVAAIVRLHGAVLELLDNPASNAGLEVKITFGHKDFV
jgi:signal transduction histidine kinase